VGGQGIILLDDSQALLARPSDKGSMKMKTLERLEALSSQ
jgi:hypothetical protein